MIIKNIEENKAKEMIKEIDSMIESQSEDLSKAKKELEYGGVLYKFPMSKSYVVTLDYRGYDCDYCILIDSPLGYGVNVLLFNEDEIDYALRLQDEFSEEDILE